MLHEVYIIFTTAKCPKHVTMRVHSKQEIYENEDADQLRGNSVTYQRLCSRFLNPGISTVENR